MEQTYTDYTLIKLIYGECSIPERFEMEYAIDNDSKIKKTFRKLLAAYKELPKVLFRPSDKTMANILLFSSSYTA